jgi:hypothetical protein
VTARLRKASLHALTQRFVVEAMRLEFSKEEVSAMVNTLLEEWNADTEA